MELARKYEEFDLRFPRKQRGFDLARPESARPNVSWVSDRPQIFTCFICQRWRGPEIQLRRHMERHFGCVRDGCYERYCNVEDLMRHDETHGQQSVCYRCDGTHRNNDGSKCYQVFFTGNDEYRLHLETSGLSSDEVQRQSLSNWLPSFRFWCGFCNEIVGRDDFAGHSSERARHLRDHFDSGAAIGKWVDLGSNGLNKSEAAGPSGEQTEWFQTVMPLEHAPAVAGAVDTTHSCKSDQAHGAVSPVVPPGFKVERDEQMEIDTLPSSSAVHKSTEGSVKVELELKYHTTETGRQFHLDREQPRYSIEPRYSHGARATDELLQIEHMRLSDEPMRAVASRQTDELDENVFNDRETSRVTAILSLDQIQRHMQSCRLPQCLTEGGVPRVFFCNIDDLLWHMRTVHGRESTYQPLLSRNSRYDNQQLRALPAVRGLHTYS